MGTLAIISLILGIAGITASAISASNANEANKQMNTQNNETQKELARESYQNSTPKVQLEELRRAGYSEQQSKMLVAGNYTPAQQPLATTTPATALPVLDSSMLSSLIGNVTAPLMNAGVSSYGDPNGGIFGTILADPVTSEIASHLHELNIGDVCTPANFAKFASSDDAPEWAKNLVQSEDWKKMSKSLMAQRAYTSWFRDNNAFYTWEQNFDYQELVNDLTAGQKIIQEYDTSLKNLETIHEQIRTGILTEQQEQERIQTKLKQIGFSEADLNLKSHQFLYATQNAAALQRLKTQMVIDRKDYQLWTDPRARTSYIQRVIKEDAFAASLAQYQEAQLRDQMFLFQTSPDFRAAYATMEALHSMNITDEDIYREMWLNLSPELQERLEVNDTDNTVLDNAGQSVWLLSRGKAISNTIGSFSSWFKPKPEPKPEVLGKVISTERTKRGSVTTSRNIYEW